MKNMPNFGLALLFIALAFSCKQQESPAEESATTETTADAVTPNTLQKSDYNATIISSNAAIEPKNSNRKVVRTADIKFKVKDVAQSTYAIENAVHKFGGMVTNTNLQSHINERKNTKISADTTLQTTRFTVENNLTIRVPNTKLDTVIKNLVKEVAFLDYRVITADDVALKMLSNQLIQSRTENHNVRLRNAIDNKGKKITDINTVENGLLDTSETRDNALVENLSLQDKVRYSTLTLALYQNESVKQEYVAIAKAPETYGNFGLEIIDGLKTGWYILERFIAFVVQLWSLILLGGIGFFAYRKLKKQKSVVSN